MFVFIVLVIMMAYLAYSVYAKRQHDKGMQRFEHRVHVNGIRGKSSVTRLIAAALREGGIKTAAKTTGSAARILIDHANETPVPRKEPDIVEQRRMLNTTWAPCTVCSPAKTTRQSCSNAWQSTLCTSAT